MGDPNHASNRARSPDFDVALLGTIAALAATQVVLGLAQLMMVLAAQIAAAFAIAGGVASVSLVVFVVTVGREARRDGGAVSEELHATGEVLRLLGIGGIRMAVVASAGWCSRSRSSRPSSPCTWPPSRSPRRRSARSSASSRSSGCSCARRSAACGVARYVRAVTRDARRPRRALSPQSRASEHVVRPGGAPPGGPPCRIRSRPRRAPRAPLPLRSARPPG